jgi:hypothetical protein
MSTCRIIGVPQVGSGDAIDDPVYLQPKIFQLSSVSRIFQQYDMPLRASIAVCAARLSGISTKPKPRERPVSRSCMILTG